MIQQQTVENLTDELIAVVLIATNNPCERMELFDYIIRRMYQVKINYATNSAGSSESAEGSGTLKERI